MKLLMVVPKHEWNNEDYDPEKDLQKKKLEDTSDTTITTKVVKNDKEMTKNVVKSLKEIVTEVVEKKKKRCCLLPNNCCFLKGKGLKVLPRCVKKTSRRIASH